MASGLFRLKSSLSAKLIPCIRSSTFHSTNFNPGCRSLMSFAFNTGIAEDSFPLEKEQKPSVKYHEVVSLKEKEKGDWRLLTLEEKQSLYHMSFTQPFSEYIDQPADEWKVILGTTFTAMGLMTFGLYIWKAKQVGSMEPFSGPISFQTEMTEGEKMNVLKLKRREVEN